MGANQSGRDDFHFDDRDVNFDHFHILRAIGKGSFGKVCIVQKKDTKQMFAMKYMNKAACAEREAMRNVLREVELLTQLEHPFLVNLWFSFQDEEDLFMVSDLLLGGDLRYHIQHQVIFCKESVVLMVYELATALDYLHEKRILHRDIKPDNILLDEEGHAHITDFNIATQLGEMELATSMSGTKPYMSPEIFDCAADACVGYSYPVDWWSLGIVAYEMIAGERPYDIHSQTGVSDVRQLFLTPFRLPQGIDKQLAEMIKRLLNISPGGRCSSLDELKKMPAFSKLDHKLILQKQYKPAFCPPKDHLNCDPTFELEEMIVETKPLHKKKKRLAKQKSMREIQIGSLDLDSQQNSPTLEPTIPNIIPEFITYNRYKELEKKERERRRLEREIKEKEWEQELATAMGEMVTLDESKKTDSNSNLEHSNRSSTRTQDGCDILVNSELYSGFGKVYNDSEIFLSDTDTSGCSKDKICNFKNSKGEKTVSSLDSENPKHVSKNEMYESLRADKHKFGSESDLKNMKKKTSKICFERNLFSLKEKNSSPRWKKNFSRASSLKVAKETTKCDMLDDNEYQKVSEISTKFRDFSDDVKSRIARSPKLKHLKSTSESQKSSTFMGDTNYQKTKNEVMKNYQASLTSSLKNDENS